jgi:uncharacterized protein with NAD-binding domain and iron-sulfur cluster
VVVLGGGVGAITAAFELTRPELNDRYDVTVYQLGWRLGGKGASGRGEDGRIEEHGLHIWFGFYESAFRCLRECYDELDRRKSVPIRNVEDAFRPASLFGVTEPLPDRWYDWLAQFPDNDGQPGYNSSRFYEPPTVATHIVELLRLGESLVRSLIVTAGRVHVNTQVPGSPPDSAPVRLVVPGPTITMSAAIAAAQERIKTMSKIGDVIEIGALVAALEIASTLQDLADWAGEQPSTILDLLDSFMGGFQDRVLQVVADDRRSQRVAEIVDLLVTIVRGLINDGVVTHELGLEILDSFDLRDWLYLHGAQQSTLDGGLLRGIYDLVFAYRDGDKRQPAFSAAHALRGMFRMFFEYKGSFAYRMQAGMGDVVFAPYYEVLLERGVKFEFFHEVVSLVPSADGRRIDEVVIARQANLKEGQQRYDPLFPVKGLPCWPSQPCWEQLRDEGDGRDRKFESPWPASPRVGRLIRLRVGADFDHIVFGLSLGPVRSVCRRILRQKPAWRKMVEEIGTVPTQALQLWLDKPTVELGGNTLAPVMSGYAEPFDTYADMSHLLKAEAWEGPGAPQSIHYFCSPLPGPRLVPEPWPAELLDEARSTVRENATGFLKDRVGHFLPGAVDYFPSDFRWDLLRGEYLRANVAPSERYVLSLPGTEQYRLDPGDSGYENLALAGDWTKTALNAGCVESATLSGLLAAQAVTGARHPVAGRRAQIGR